MYRPYAYHFSSPSISNNPTNNRPSSNYADFYGSKPVMNNNNNRPQAQQQMTSSNNTNDDLSTIGSILGAVVCFLLFFLIIFSIAYPFTMYRTPRPHSHIYSDDLWWCYHCHGMTGCASHCW